MFYLYACWIGELLKAIYADFFFGSQKNLSPLKNVQKNLDPPFVMWKKVQPPPPPTLMVSFMINMNIQVYSKEKKLVGRLGWQVESSDTILKEDHLRTIHQCLVSIGQAVSEEIFKTFFP